MLRMTTGISTSWNNTAPIKPSPTVPNVAFTPLPTTLVHHPGHDGCMSIIFSPIWFGPHCSTCDLQPTKVVVPCGVFVPFNFRSASNDASQTSVTATTRWTSYVLSYGHPSSSQLSSVNLSSSEITAIAIGTVLAVGVVRLLLFCPHFLSAWLIKAALGIALQKVKKSLWRTYLLSAQAG